MENSIFSFLNVFVYIYIWSLVTKNKHKLLFLLGFSVHCIFVMLNTTVKGKLFHLVYPAAPHEMEWIYLCLCVYIHTHIHTYCWYWKQSAISLSHYCIQFWQSIFFQHLFLAAVALHCVLLFYSRINQPCIYMHLLLWLSLRSPQCLKQSLLDYLVCARACVAQSDPRL